MAVIFSERRRFLQMVSAAVAASGALAAPTFADADPSTRESVIEAAKGESGLVWYDQYDRAASEAILAAFQRAYPFVKQVQFVAVPAVQKTARIIQESLAGGPTADVLLNDATVQQSLFARGLLLESDWKALGVTTSPVTTPTSYMMVVTTSFDVLLYNTDLVKGADVPRSWEDAFDPKWAGHTGHWMRATFFVHLLPALGEAKVRDLLGRLAALRPRLFEGLFPLAQALGSGEISLAVASHDSAVRLVEKGAPVDMVELEPTSTALICGSAPKYGRSPNTARLFLAWLATPDGAITFEKMTKRGNYFVPGTETSKLLKGHQLSYFTAEQSIAQANKLNALEAEFSRELAGR